MKLTQIQLYSTLQANRWRKRGLSVVPVRWGVDWRGGKYSSLVSVYHADGSVAVAHGGVEVGQGVNTKVRELKLDCCLTLHIEHYIG